MRRLIATLAILNSLGVITPASTDECEAPCFAYDMEAELQGDWIFAAKPARLKSADIEPTVSGGFSLSLTNQFQIVASTTLESVVDPVVGRDSFFRGIGLYAEELYGLLDFESLIVRFGKFNTIFSFFSEIDPGINAADLVSEIDADERWAGEVVLPYRAFGMNHSLAATMFTSDRTFLSESIFTNRSRTKLSDGDAGNTSGISSFSITLQGCRGAEIPECFDGGELAYRIGARFQRAARASADQLEDGIKPHDETAVMGAVMTRHNVGGLDFHLLGEADYIRQLGGGGADVLILTGLAMLEDGPMTYMGSFSHQQSFGRGYSGTTGQLMELSVFYQADEDEVFAGGSWSLGAAYDYGQNAEGQYAHVLSVLFSYALNGSVSKGR